MRGSVAAVVAVIGVTAAVADAPKTGTDPGQVIPGPFSAYVVAGGPAQPPSEPVQTDDRRNYADSARAGKFHDLVTRYGLDPVVAVFIREPAPAENQPLGQLLKTLDGAVQKHKDARLHAFAVFLGLKQDFLKDETRVAQVRRIEEFANKAGIKEMPLALDLAESERSKKFDLAPGNTVTVLIWSNHVVFAKFAFTADKPLDEAVVKTVLAEVEKLVKK